MNRGEIARIRERVAERGDTPELYVVVSRGVIGDPYAVARGSRRTLDG